MIEVSRFGREGHEFMISCVVMDTALFFLHA